MKDVLMRGGGGGVERSSRCMVEEPGTCLRDGLLLSPVVHPVAGRGLCFLYRNILKIRPMTSGETWEVIVEGWGASGGPRL